MKIRSFAGDTAFFGILAEQAKLVLRGAEELERGLSEYSDATSLAATLRQLEHDGDELHHRNMGRLNVTFVTPFEREDIVALSDGLDDILDFVEEVADTFVLYRVGKPSPESVKQATILRQQCEVLVRAMEALPTFHDLGSYKRDVHALEKQADLVARAAVTKLFASQDVKYVLAWKDLYGLLEEANDRADQVAGLLERIGSLHPSGASSA